VADYAKVRDFYIDLFGMKCVWDDGKQCSLEFGDPPNAIYLRPAQGSRWTARPAADPAQTGRSKWGKGTSIIWRSRSRISTGCGEKPNSRAAA